MNPGDLYTVVTPHPNVPMSRFRRELDGKAHKSVVRGQRQAFVTVCQGQPVVFIGYRAAKEGSSPVSLFLTADGICHLELVHHLARVTT